MPVWDQFVELIRYGLSYFADLAGSAGLSVIIFTVLLKTILLPLTVKSVRSMYAMQEIQPKIKELQKKYGNDRQRLSAETMKLYQEEGVSPTAGCLPMLLQIPIFFGLYFAIRELSGAGQGVWGQGFLWIPDLAHPDPLHILPLVAGLFQLLQALMSRPANQPKAADAQQQMMNTMMMFMPLMVVVFGWNFSSGPVLYWAVSAFYSVVQQWFITGWGRLGAWFTFLPELPEHRRLGYVDAATRAAEKERVKASGGGLFGRLTSQMQQQIERTNGSAGEEPPPPRTRTGAQGGRSGRSRQTRAAQKDEPDRSPPPAELVPRRTRTVRRRQQERSKKPPAGEKDAGG